MEEIIKIITKLKKIRKVPQFLFNEYIIPISMLGVRKGILDHKRNNDDDEIDFILNSPGGSSEDAYRIIRTLRTNFEKVNIIIPFWAKSAATLLALGGSRIIMDEFGEFGPLDVQLPKEKEDSPDYDQESALIDELSLIRIETRSRELFASMFLQLYNSKHYPIKRTELSKQLFEYLSSFYEPLLKQINPYKLGEKKRMLDVGEMYATRILTQYHNKEDVDIKYFVDFLINGCPDHGYIIDFDIMHHFLPYIEKSTTFGDEYAVLLTELSNYFIEFPDTKLFAGFIIEPEIEESQSSKAKTSEKLKPKNEKKTKLPSTG